MKQTHLVIVMIGFTLTTHHRVWGLSRAPMQLTDVVKQADLIVVGTVSDSSKGTAAVAVSETLKGTAGRSIAVTGIREWRSEPRVLPKGKEYLLFLKALDGKYQIVGANLHLEGLREPAAKEDTRKLMMAEEAKISHSPDAENVLHDPILIIRGHYRDSDGRVSDHKFPVELKLKGDGTFTGTS